LTKSKKRARFEGYSGSVSHYRSMIFTIE